MKIDQADICIQIQDESDWNRVQSHLINQLGYRWEIEAYGYSLPEKNGLRDYPGITPWRTVVDFYWIFLDKSKKVMTPFHSIIPIQSKVVTSQEIITWGDQDRIGIREAKIKQIF